MSADIKPSLVLHKAKLASRTSEDLTHSDIVAMYMMKKQVCIIYKAVIMIHFQVDFWMQMYYVIHKQVLH